MSTALLRRAISGSALALVLVSCCRMQEAAPVAAIPEPPPPPPPPPQPACLVLSVGAEKGLAHLGVIQALQERHIEIDCVIGTSMGSLVGALYASAPEGDPSEAYRTLFQAYVKKTKSEAADRGIVGFLLGAALVVASGGAAAPALAAGAGAGALGAATTSERDLERLRVVMDEYFQQKRIEDLPLQYRTIHQRVGETGMGKHPIRGGNLAEEVSWSIANPLIFPGIKLKSGARIDPGADSVAAIPLEYACREFPDHQFIVSNVTGDDVFTSQAMNCPYQEIRPDPVVVDRKKAIIAEEPDFSQLIQSGAHAALASLRWELLPVRPAHKKKETHIP